VHRNAGADYGASNLADVIRGVKFENGEHMQLYSKPRDGLFRREKTNTNL